MQRGLEIAGSAADSLEHAHGLGACINNERLESAIKLHLVRPQIGGAGEAGSPWTRPAERPSLNPTRLPAGLHDRQHPPDGGLPEQARS